jgi:hypothetical protein
LRLTSYQYGIVLSGYKSGSDDAQPKSEIVWQAEGKSAVGQGYFNATTDPKTERKMGDVKVTASVKTINTYSGNDTTLNEVDRPEEAEITISNLEFGYRYRFYIQYYNNPGAALPDGSAFGGGTQITPNWKTDLDPNAGYNGGEIEYERTTGLRWNNNNSTAISPIENYVDTGSWDVPIVIPVDLTAATIPLDDTSVNADFANWQARVYAVIGVDTDKYYLYTTDQQQATTGLQRTWKSLATFGPTF